MTASSHPRLLQHMVETLMTLFMLFIFVPFACQHGVPLSPIVAEQNLIAPRVLRPCPRAIFLLRSRYPICAVARTTVHPLQDSVSPHTHNARQIPNLAAADLPIPVFESVPHKETRYGTSAVIVIPTAFIWRTSEDPQAQEGGICTKNSSRVET